jgi:hypothetical protein
VSDIVDISKHSPHLVIHSRDSVHVIPVATMRDIANGDADISDLEKWETILPAIIKEWLGLLQK